MKRIFEISSALIAMCLVTLTGCSPEELSTDQYVDDAVVLNVYGPQPVVRGGQLRFLGSNLDQVVQVIIPGVDPITEIEVVQAGVPSEIRIIVPKDGPEPGLVTLVADDGTEIVTKTELTYSEPIEFTGFTPATAAPGDIITITGDYLNLINEVVFSDNVLVSGEDFETHTRYEIQVKVPAEARTGVVGIGDLDMTLPENDGLFANIIESEEELTVTLPSVTGLAPTAVRPGDEVTITGTLMDCIASVEFAGASAVDAADFVSRDAEQIVVTVPADAHDGEVTCVSASGIDIPTGVSVTIGVPEVIGVSAESRFKAGLDVVISGTDLDLVTGVTFSGDVAAEFSYSSETGAITATIPAAAEDGAITLSTAAEKTVGTPTVTLVRPVITGFGTSSVMAGEEFTVTGTDLDLVTGVKLNGADCAFEIDSETGLTVTTVLTSTTGIVTVVVANGTEVESADELTVNHNTVTNVTSITGTVKVGENATMTGTSFNMIESIYLGTVKVTSYISRSDTEIVFTVPADLAPGTYNPHFVLTTGEEEDSAVSFEVQGTTTVIALWEGSWDCGNWGGNQDLAWGGYDWSSLDISQGTATLVAEVEQDASASWWQFMLKSGTSWADLAGMQQIDMTAGQTVVEVPFTQVMLDDLIANNGLIITGCNYTLKRLTIEIE